MIGLTVSEPSVSLQGFTSLSRPSEAVPFSSPLNPRLLAVEGSTENFAVSSSGFPSKYPAPEVFLRLAVVAEEISLSTSSGLVRAC